jgi:uncharacterized protein YegP (UPF0339 family)
MAHFTLYKDNSRQYRWTFYADNGKAIAVSSESYHNKQDCVNAINIVKTKAPAAPVKDETGEQ